jgi:hypothetical protein
LEIGDPRESRDHAAARWLCVMRCFHCDVYVAGHRLIAWLIARQWAATAKAMLL